LSGALFLVSCGGGGGGGSTPAAPPAPALPTAPVIPPTAPAPAPVDPNAQYSLVTTEPAATYTSGSPKETLYKSLNKVRSAGYGFLTQSAELDVAAQGHAAYVGRTLEVGHVQQPGSPGFTGATIADRLKAAGYTGAAGEVVAGYATAASVEKVIAGILGTVYHGQILESSGRDIGIGVARDITGTQDIVVILVGVKSSAAPQLPPATGVKFYPGEAQTDVPPTFYIAGEVPRPLPELSIAGQPAFFSIDNVAELGTAAQGITVESFEMKDVSGNLVPTLLMTAANVNVAAALVPTRRVDAMLGHKNFYAVPRSALVPDATYSASVRIRTANAFYTKTWTFKTGATN
jgi:uncharacterized protein YkwD